VEVEAVPAQQGGAAHQQPDAVEFHAYAHVEDDLARLVDGHVDALLFNVRDDRLRRRVPGVFGRGGSSVAGGHYRWDPKRDGGSRAGEPSLSPRRRDCARNELCAQRRLPSAAPEWSAVSSS
jgi:hypothetical protein